MSKEDLIRQEVVKKYPNVLSLGRYRNHAYNKISAEESNGYLEYGCLSGDTSEVLAKEIKNKSLNIICASLSSNGECLNASTRQECEAKKQQGVIVRSLLEVLKI